MKWLLIAVFLYLIWRITRPMLAAGQKRRGGGTDAPYDPPREREPHDILGVPRGANRDEVHAAYQREIQRYHPDKVEDLGEELKEVAERRTKELNAAYEQLKRR